MTLVALLRVGTDPVRRLAVVGALLPPELGDLADDGSMISGFSTTEGEREGTSAHSSRDEEGRPERH